MRVVITGAGGFVGQILAKKLIESDPSTSLVLADVKEPSNPTESKDVKTIAADLTDPSAVDALFEKAPDAVYILHGIMSSGSEANLGLGLKVNFDSVRHLIDIARVKQPGVKIVFTSSCAVFGRAAVKNVATETDIVPMPESSYGTQKMMMWFHLQQRNNSEKNSQMLLPTSSTEQNDMDISIELNNYQNWN